VSFFKIVLKIINSKYIASEIRDILRRLGLEFTDLRHAFITLDGGFIIDKFERNEGFNNIELIKISNVVDQILYLTKRSYYFYSSKEPFDYVFIECNSSCYFMFRQSFGFFYIKISTPKHMIKLKVRQTQSLKNYKKDSQF